MAFRQVKEVELLSADTDIHGIRVNVMLSHLKGRPITQARLTDSEALRLADQLIRSVYRRLPQ